MAMLDVVYIHAKDPEYPESRRKTVGEMEEYVKGLVYELKFNGISTDFKSVEGDHNDVTINGKSLKDIIRDLGDDIRIPEVGEGETSPVVSIGSRDPKSWNIDCVEDISDLLMKNAFSISYAEARKEKLPTY
ncbi:MAG: hypothetical protein E7Z63_00300 [Thermoplasmata archaeon]|nr:hypothetical protein [Thermoplasmata archaeon]